MGRANSRKTRRRRFERLCSGIALMNGWQYESGQGIYSFKNKPFENSWLVIVFSGISPEQLAEKYMNRFGISVEELEFMLAVRGIRPSAPVF